MNIQNDMSEIIGVDASSSSVPIHINDKLEKISSSSPKHTIFKVHALLRAQNEMAYEPNIVAIGPYHRGKDRLRVMEDLKLRWLKSTLEKLGESNATKYVEAMKRLEPKARQCYSESTENMSQDEFAEMLLIDACFIIQFMRSCLVDGLIEAEPFFQLWTIFSSMFDMLLFENQIPLFVVQELYSMLPDQEPTHFHDLALRILSQLSEGMFNIPIGTMSNHSTLNDVNDIEHILGILHCIFRSVAAVSRDSVPDETAKAKWTIQLCETAWLKFITKKLRKCGCGWFDQKDPKNIGDLFSKSEYIPSAAKLHAAGVKFRSKKVDGRPFEINFENGVMEIPKLRLGYGTERLYRNLIAYEEYSQEMFNNRCIGLHAKLMDCLIDSAEDVALLRSIGMVFSYLGDDQEVSTMFNKLASHALVTNNLSNARVAKIFEDVNVYYGKRRHRWMAKLRSEYFNSPWALISFLAALLLLLLTITQTVFSILK